MVRWITLLRIGDLARRCEVSRDTLRFYERERLIAPPRRSDAGYRLYGEPDAERVQFIRQAQAVGLTLDDIRELLSAQRLRTPGACRRVAERLRARIEVIDRKISELNAVRRELAKGLAQCDEGADSCPVVLRFAQGSLAKGAIR
jgi:MerR family Zn(II)-responsive transcriptional regulator of zntA